MGLPSGGVLLRQKVSLVLRDIEAPNAGLFIYFLALLI